MANSTEKQRPKWERYLPILLILLIAYCISDLLILNYRDLMIPQQAPPAKLRKANATQMARPGAYASVTSRNVFSFDGSIPDALRPEGEENKPKEDLPPVPSNLPLALEGTIVHSNPEKSIANINVRSKNQVIPYAPGRDIEGLATLVSVERKKVILRNSNNGQLEFIEMKDANAKIAFQGARPAVETEVKQVSANKFEIKRTDLEKNLKDLGSILQQAAMVPQRNASGEIECFKFLAIQPGSVYTQLGMSVGDCIESVNGQKIDSPAKAMELYQALRGADSISIGRQRDGRKDEVQYSIR